ncbi:hypothetical protein AJ79_03705 [Helicocarpus griseus UAMH5409]|uniref:Mid2 domain-containing protein n=1 Tax=Helicocarpus griseus UAMH5409 TaxID=1447875 RepID=A0A2B7XW59_9EURO|nr:hypothetical protein AJ79_03705 [Helicocarpus griseus UAMH5409]
MLSLLFALILLIYPCVGAEPGIFYNPPTGGPIHEYKDNPIYELGQTVQLRWATTLEYFSLVLWQNDNPQFEWIQTNITGITTYNWVVSTQRDLRDGEVFFFQIRDASDVGGDNFFGSHYFNITNSDSEDSTTATTSSTPSSSSLSSTSTAIETPTQVVSTSTTPTTTSIPSTVSSTTSDTGLAPQAKVGVGVGVGLGLAFLIILALVIWCFRRRVSNDTNHDKPQEYYPSDPIVLDKQHIAPQELPQPRPLFEVPGQSTWHEGMRYELQTSSS